MGEFLHPWGQFGLIGLMIGAIVLLLFFVIKWTLATTKDILNTNARQVEAFQEAQKGWISALNEHTAQAKSFHDEVKEAHAYQRQEHQEMIKCLGRLNGYK